eukprot:COSAG05_NODE_2493_length_2990_cov_1.086129_2_plen_84_part_00
MIAGDRDAGAALAANPAVMAISFTGSSATGSAIIANTAGKSVKYRQASASHQASEPAEYLSNSNIKLILVPMKHTYCTACPLI